MLFWTLSTNKKQAHLPLEQTRLYKTLIRSVLKYGLETWSMTKADENYLIIFERKILRRIYDPTHEEDGCQRCPIEDKRYHDM